MELTELLRDGEAALQRAIDAQEVETLTLDFKEVGQGKEALFADGKVSKQGQLVIGPAASAFANSAGGLLVIGVRCKVIDGIDAASALIPIGDLKRCQSSLSGLLGSTLQPRHDGLRLHAISSRGDEGYLVIEVPRSDRRPHMSQIDRRYYKRSGASTFIMEHYDIEDAFRRIAAPKLELRRNLVHRMRSGSGEVKQRMVLSIAVANVGEVSAKELSVGLADVRGAAVEVAAGPGVSVSEFGLVRTISHTPPFAIHPGETRQFVNLEFYAWGSASEVARLGQPPRYASATEFDLIVSAEHMRPLTERVVLTLDDVQQRWGR